MTQSSKSPRGPKLKAMVAIVIVAFAGLGAFFFLTTETSCTYQTNPGGPSHIGMQTYWEKLVGGSAIHYQPSLPADIHILGLSHQACSATIFLLPFIL